MTERHSIKTETLLVDVIVRGKKMFLTHHANGVLVFASDPGTVRIEVSSKDPSKILHLRVNETRGNGGTIGNVVEALPDAGPVVEEFELVKGSSFSIWWRFPAEPEPDQIQRGVAMGLATLSGECRSLILTWMRATSPELDTFVDDAPAPAPETVVPDKAPEVHAPINPVLKETMGDPW